MILGEAQPGGDVGVVIHAGHDQLVAGLEGLADGPAQVEVERGHVRPEDDFLPVRRVEEVRDGLACGMFHGVGALAGGERAAMIGVHAGVVFGHGIDHPLGNLGSGRVVEMHGQRAAGVHGALQCRELGAQRGYIDRHKFLLKNDAIHHEDGVEYAGQQIIVL